MLRFVSSRKMVHECRGNPRNKTKNHLKKHTTLSTHSSPLSSPTSHGPPRPSPACILPSFPARHHSFPESRSAVTQPSKRITSAQLKSSFTHTTWRNDNGLRLPTRSSVNHGPARRSVIRGHGPRYAWLRLPARGEPRLARPGSHGARGREVPGLAHRRPPPSLRLAPLGIVSRVGGGLPSR